jgi:hypothetical protein
MMRYFAGLVLIAVAASANAAPFVVADVVAGVSSCGVTLDGQPQPAVTASNNQCRFDVSGVSNGQHTMTMTARTVNDPVWGTQESAPSAPFVFAKPAAPAVPGNLRLVQ